MQIKSKKISIDMDSLVREEKWEEAIQAGRRQVKWLHSNGRKTAMVLDEGLVRLMVRSLEAKIVELRNPVKKTMDPGSHYDEFFGDERMCQCGHLYRQHFDSAENMRHIGCKYCDCYDFKEKEFFMPGTL